MNKVVTCTVDGDPYFTKGKKYEVVNHGVDRVIVRDDSNNLSHLKTNEYK